MTTKQLLTNATSGESAEFNYADFETGYKLKLVISGTPSTPINAYIDYLPGQRGFLVGISGIVGGGATVKMQSKSKALNAIFQDTDDLFTKDGVRVHYYK